MIDIKIVLICFFLIILESCFFKRDLVHIYLTSNLTTIDYSPPLTTIEKANNQDRITQSFPINFSLTFNEAINPTTLSTGDIVQSGTATDIVWSITPLGDNRTFTIQAISATATGSILPTISASAVLDLSGNENLASTGIDNTVFYDFRPNPPTHVHMIRSNPTEMNFEWAIGGTDTTSYKIKYSTSEISDCSAAQITKAGNENSANITGLTANTLYYFAICSNNGTSDSEPILRSGKTLPLCDVNVTVNTATDKAKLIIAAGATPGGATSLTIESKILGSAGENIQFEIVYGGASGLAYADRSGSGTNVDPYKVTITAYDDDSSNDAIINAIVADPNTNAIISATGPGSTHGASPSLTVESLYLGFSFDEFQTIMNSAQTNRAVHTAGDGLVVICLGDQVKIFNSNARQLSRMEIPGNDFYIYSQSTYDTRVLNYRGIDGVAASNWINNGLFLIDGKTNFSMTGIDFYVSTYGRLRQFFSFVNGASGTTISDLVFMTATHNDTFHFDLDNSSISEISNIRGQIAAWDGSTLKLSAASSIGLVRNYSIVGNTTRNPNIYLINGSSIGILDHYLTNISFSGSGLEHYGILINNNSHINSFTNSIFMGQDWIRALYLVNNSYIGHMENILFRRVNNQDKNSFAITVEDDGTNSYFNTSQVSKIRICNGLNTTNKWELSGIGVVGLLADAVDELRTYPITHQAYPGNFGAQTFPFTDLTLNGDQGLPGHIQMGGDCPVGEINNLIVAGKTNSSVTLSWDPPAANNATHYRIIYDTTSFFGIGHGCANGNRIYEGSFAGTTVTITGLKANTTYYFSVCAINTNVHPKDISQGTPISTVTDP